MKSKHDQLTRLRKQRVHITYEVETENAKVEKELPFVVGVLGDFSGNATQQPLKERKFVQVDRDNFNNVMAKMTPAVNLRMANTLANDDTEMMVRLEFNSMKDFEPSSIVQQVAPLKQLLEVRNKLRDLVLETSRSGELESLLEQVLQGTEELNKILDGTTR